MKRLIFILLLCCTDVKADPPLILVSCEPDGSGNQICVAVDPATGDQTVVIVPPQR